MSVRRNGDGGHPPNLDPTNGQIKGKVQADALTSISSRPNTGYTRKESIQDGPSGTIAHYHRRK